MDKPRTKAKPSAKQDDTPEALDADLRRVLLLAAATCQQRFDEKPTRHAYHLAAILEALGRDPRLIDPVYKKIQSIEESRVAASGRAVVTAIGGVPVRRLARNKDGPIFNKGGPVYQRIQGRPAEGPNMVDVTRWAIGVYDADPLNVTAAVMDRFPPLLKADCLKWAETDAERVGLAIEGLLDENLRSAMIANREDSRAANVDYGLMVANAEQCDRANANLLDAPEWRKVPEKVLRAILRELGHPTPDNLTR